MKLWELSDGRLIQIRPFGERIMVSSILAGTGHLSRIGDFADEEEFRHFLAYYMRLTVTDEVSQ